MKDQDNSLQNRWAKVGESQQVCRLAILKLWNNQQSINQVLWCVYLASMLAFMIPEFNPEYFDDHSR